MCSKILQPAYNVARSGAPAGREGHGVCLCACVSIMMLPDICLLSLARALVFVTQGKTECDVSYSVTIPAGFSCSQDWIAVFGGNVEGNGPTNGYVYALLPLAKPHVQAACVCFSIV